MNLIYIGNDDFTSDGQLPSMLIFRYGAIVYEKHKNDCYVLTNDIALKYIKKLEIVLIQKINYSGHIIFN